MQIPGRFILQFFTWYMYVLNPGPRLAFKAFEMSHSMLAA